MNPQKNTILFTLIYKDEEYRIQTAPDQYYSLMSLISEQLPVAGFGLCSGMGSCGTCLVRIDGRNTLACTVRINDDLANTQILIQEAAW